MGSLVSIVSRCGKNIVPETAKMLNVLKHRGMETHGISTDKTVIITKNLNELSNLPDIDSDIALGYNSSRILPSDVPQPLEGKGFKIIFEGRIFSPPIRKDEIVTLISRFNNIEDAAKNIISNVSGSFSFIILEDKRLLAGRDPMGGVPFYFGSNERFYALASERKALWLLDIKNDHIKSFPPGNLAEITSSGVKFHPIKTLKKPRIKPIKENDAIRELHKLLLKSVKERIADLEKASLAFSGGLDSSIIAFLMKECGINPLLISVGLEGTKELEYAEKIAEEIDLPFVAETYTLDDVEETLLKVLWLIEEANALRAAICIPTFWVAKLSSKLNYQVAFSGQGSDELFAGYYKYLNEFGKSKENAEQNLYRDVLKLYENGLEQDEKIYSFHGVEVRFPYVDFDLASFALSLPITLKIESERDSLRKRILRKLAKHIGLPPEVYLKPKKAIQYGTGVNEALKKIAKRKGLSMRGLINQIFKEMEWFI